MRPRLAELEGSGLEARSAELLVVLAWLVARDIGIGEDDLNAARRRAMAQGRIERSHRGRAPAPAPRRRGAAPPARRRDGV